MPGAYDKSYSWAYNTGCAWYPHCKMCEDRGDVYICGDLNSRGNTVEKISDDTTQGTIVWGLKVGDFLYDKVACNDTKDVWIAGDLGLTKISPSGTNEWTHKWSDPTEPDYTVVREYQGLAVAPGGIAYMGTYYRSQFERQIGITRFDPSGGYTQGPISEQSNGTFLEQMDCDNVGNVVATGWLRDTDSKLVRFSPDGTEMWRIGDSTIWGRSLAVRIDPVTSDILVGTADFGGPGLLRRITAGGVEINDGTWPIAVTDVDDEILSISLTSTGDIFLLFTSQSGPKMRRYSAAGAVQWTTNASSSTEIEVNESGEVYAVTGVVVRKFIEGVGDWQYDWDGVSGGIPLNIAVDPGRAGAFR